MFVDGLKIGRGEIGLLSATAIERAVRAWRMLDNHERARPIRAKRGA